MCFHFVRDEGMCTHVRKLLNLRDELPCKSTLLPIELVPRVLLSVVSSPTHLSNKTRDDKNIVSQKRIILPFAETLVLPTPKKETKKKWTWNHSCTLFPLCVIKRGKTFFKDYFVLLKMRFEVLSTHKRTKCVTHYREGGGLRGVEKSSAYEGTPPNFPLQLDSTSNCNCNNRILNLG